MAMSKNQLDTFKLNKAILTDSLSKELGRKPTELEIMDALEAKRNAPALPNVAAPLPTDKPKETGPFIDQPLPAETVEEIFLPSNLQMAAEARGKGSIFENVLNRLTQQQQAAQAGTAGKDLPKNYNTLNPDLEELKTAGKIVGGGLAGTAALGEMSKAMGLVPALGAGAYGTAAARQLAENLRAAEIPETAKKETEGKASVEDYLSYPQTAAKIGEAVGGAVLPKESTNLLGTLAKALTGSVKGLSGGAQKILGVTDTALRDTREAIKPLKDSPTLRILAAIAGTSDKAPAASAISNLAFGEDITGGAGGSEADLEKAMETQALTLLNKPIRTADEDNLLKTILPYAAARKSVATGKNPDSLSDLYAVQVISPEGVIKTEVVNASDPKVLNKELVKQQLTNKEAQDYLQKGYLGGKTQDVFKEREEASKEKQRVAGSFGDLSDQQSSAYKEILKNSEDRLKINSYAKKQVSLYNELVSLANEMGSNPTNKQKQTFLDKMTELKDAMGTVSAMKSVGTGQGAMSEADKLNLDTANAEISVISSDSASAGPVGLSSPYPVLTKLRQPLDVAIRSQGNFLKASDDYFDARANLYGAKEDTLRKFRGESAEEIYKSFKETIPASGKTPVEVAAEQADIDELLRAANRTAVSKGAYPGIGGGIKPKEELKETPLSFTQEQEAGIKVAMRQGSGWLNNELKRKDITTGQRIILQEAKKRLD